MHFQGLAVVLGKLRWPELISHQRTSDLGLDAYSPAGGSQERVGKGLAATITPSLGKVREDAEKAKENHPDQGALLFLTPRLVSNASRKGNGKRRLKDIGLELHVIEREEIITQLMMPEIISLCASFLYLPVDAKPEIADLVDRTRRAAALSRRAAPRKRRDIRSLSLQQ